MIELELEALPSVVTDLVVLLGRASEVAGEAVPRLQNPALLTDSAVELNRLGAEAGAEEGVDGLGIVND